MSLGSMVIDEVPVPIQRMWLERGALHFTARWTPRRPVQSGTYDIVVFCPDGSLYVRHYQHIDVPTSYRLGDSVQLRLDLTQVDHLTEELRT